MFKLTPFHSLVLIPAFVLTVPSPPTPAALIVQNPTLEEQITEAVYLNQQAYDLYQKGQPEEAIALYQKALQIFQQLDAPAGAANSLNGIGEVYLALAQPEQALASFQQALVLWKSVNDPTSIGYTLQYLGNTQESLKNFPQALNHYQEAAAIFQRLRASQTGDPDSVRTSLILSNSALAALQFKTGDYSSALTQYQNVLALQREATDKIGQAYTLNNLGVLYANVSQYALALQHYQEALAILTDLSEGGKLRYLGIETAILNNLSSLSLILGDVNQALVFSQQATTLYQTWQNSTPSQTQMQSIELLRDILNQSFLDPQIVQQSLAIRPPIGEGIDTDFIKAGEAVNFLNLARIYQQQADYPKALQLSQQALKTYQSLQNSRAIAIALSQIGNIYQQSGEWSSAIAYYQKALDLYRSESDPLGIAQTLSHLGQLNQARENFEPALKFYQEALSFYPPQSAGSILTRSQIGQIFLRQNKHSEAVSLLTSSLEDFEKLRTGLSDANKVSLFEQGKEIYQALQQALIAQNQPEKALEVSEQGRGRAFAELVADRLQNNLGQPLNDGISAATIRGIAQREKATLVQYSIIGENTTNPTLYIWVISPQGEITFRTSHLETVASDSNSSSPQLTRFVESTRNTLLSKRTQQSQQRLSELYGLLIQPIADLLPTNPEERVIFVPQGILFLVPFPALRTPEGQYLIERHTMVTVPALKMLVQTSRLRSKGGDDILIVGNPVMPKLQGFIPEISTPLSPLPGAEMEAKEIAKILQTSPLIGEAATESAVVQRMPQAKLIHLATHGILDEVKQLSSIPGAIALTPSGQEDGLLTPSEIFALPLHADLVVLSACNTGRGRITGDGVIGLSRAFLAAGAKSAIVSLWAVPDQPTASLMTEFYQNLAQGRDRAQALRSAMLNTLTQYPDPSQWAGFTLISPGNEN